jgi:hypothetical protein
MKFFPSCCYFLPLGSNVLRKQNKTELVVSVLIFIVFRKETGRQKDSKPNGRLLVGSSFCCEYNFDLLLLFKSRSVTVR